MRTKGLPREWSGSCSATRRSPPLSTLPIIYATASADAVADFVTAHYVLDGLSACSFLNRGFNDTYAPRDAGGAQFILRLSSPRVRGPADVAAETAFIAYLDAAGIPVAAPVPARTGALFATAPLPRCQADPVPLSCSTWPTAAAQTSTPRRTPRRKAAPLPACTTPRIAIPPGRAGDSAWTSITCCTAQSRR